MAKFTPSSLRQQANAALQSTTYPPKKLTLLHTSAALGVSFIITTINFFLTRQMDGTGGLAGLPMRSVLTTIQSVFELVGTAALPFWELSFIFMALCWSKGEAVGMPSLLQGFRRIGTALALWLMEGLLYVFLCSGILYVSFLVFSMTSLSNPFMELLAPVLQQPPTQQQLAELMTPEFAIMFNKTLLPLLAIFGGLSLLIVTPLIYRLRFVQFSIMDGNSAFSALVHSVRITHKNCLRLLWLDLSFWWYYLLQAVCLAACYGDLILPYFGYSLPFSEDAGFFLFYFLGTLLQWLLLWQTRAKVMTTYAEAYRTLWQRPLTAREQNLP